MFWFIVIAVVVIGLLFGWAKATAITAAKQQYEDALAALRAKPADPGLRQSALALGRNYANLTRDQKGVTVFDEVALMNDINAACAAAGVANQVVHAADIQERLKTLDSLRQNGLLSDDEFNAKRNEILKSI